MESFSLLIFPTFAADEDETRLLYEEATMNINDLLARYGRVCTFKWSYFFIFTEHGCDIARVVQACYKCLSMILLISKRLIF